MQSQSVKSESTNRIFQGGIQRRLEGSSRRRFLAKNDTLDELRSRGSSFSATTSPCDGSFALCQHRRITSSFDSSTAAAEGIDLAATIVSSSTGQAEDDDRCTLSHSPTVLGLTNWRQPPLPFHQSSSPVTTTTNSGSAWQQLVQSNEDALITMLLSSLMSTTTSTNNQHVPFSPPSSLSSSLPPFEMPFSPSSYCSPTSRPSEYALGLLVRGLCDHQADSFGFAPPSNQELMNEGAVSSCLPESLPRLWRCPPVDVITGDSVTNSVVTPSIARIACSLADRLSRQELPYQTGFDLLFDFVSKWANGDGCGGMVSNDDLVPLQLLWVCARIGLCARSHSCRLYITDYVLSSLIAVCLTRRHQHNNVPHSPHWTSIGGDGDDPQAISLFMALLSTQWYADAMLCSTAIMQNLASLPTDEAAFHPEETPRCDPLHTEYHLNRVSIGVTLCAAAASFGLPQVRDVSPEYIRSLLTCAISTLILCPLDIRSSQLRSGTPLLHRYQREEEASSGSPAEWLRREQKMLSRCFQSLADLIGARSDPCAEESFFINPIVYNGALSQYFWEKCRYVLFSDGWVFWKYCVVEVGSLGLLEQILNLAAEYKEIIDAEMTPELFATVFPLALHSVRCRDTLFFFFRQCPAALHRNWEAFMEHIPDLLRNRDAFTRRNVLDVILAASQGSPSQDGFPCRLEELGDILSEYDFQIGESVTEGERVLLSRIVESAAANHMWDEDGGADETGFHFEL